VTDPAAPVTSAAASTQAQLARMLGVGDRSVTNGQADQRRDDIAELATLVRGGVSGSYGASACRARVDVVVLDAGVISDATPAVPAPDPYATRAAERAFPSRLPAVGPLGAPANVYTSEVRPWPAPNPGPAGVPPVVVSETGDRVGWLLRGRRAALAEFAAREELEELRRRD